MQSAEWEKRQSDKMPQLRFALDRLLTLMHAAPPKRPSQGANVRAGPGEALYSYGLSPGRLQRRDCLPGDSVISTMTSCCSAGLIAVLLPQRPWAEDAFYRVPLAGIGDRGAALPSRQPTATGEPVRQAVA